MNVRYSFIYFIFFTFICIAQENIDEAEKKTVTKIDSTSAKIVRRVLGDNCPEVQKEAYKHFVRKTLNYVYNKVYNNENFPKSHHAFIEKSLVKECKRLDIMFEDFPLSKVEAMLEGFLRARQESLLALNPKTIDMAANFSYENFADDMSRIHQSITKILDECQFVLLDKSINSAWVELFEATNPNANQLHTYSKVANELVNSPTDFANDVNHPTLRYLILNRFAVQVNDLSHFVTSLFYINDHEYIPLKDNVESTIFTLLVEDYAIDDVIVFVDVSEIEKWTAVPLSLPLSNSHAKDFKLLTPTKQDIKKSLNRLKNISVGTPDGVSPINLNFNASTDLLASIQESAKTLDLDKSFTDFPGLGSINFDTYINWFSIVFKDMCLWKLDENKLKYTTEAEVSRIVQNFAETVKKHIISYDNVNIPHLSVLEKKCYRALLESINLIEYKLNRKNISKHFQNYVNLYGIQGGNTELKQTNKAVSAIAEHVNKKVERVAATNIGQKEKRKVLYDQGFVAFTKVIQFDLRFRKNLDIDITKSRYIKQSLKKAVSVAKKQVFSTDDIDDLNILPLPKLVLTFYEVSHKKSPIFSDLVFHAKTQELCESFFHYWDKGMTQKEKDLYTNILLSVSAACDIDFDRRGVSSDN